MGYKKSLAIIMLAVLLTGCALPMAAGPSPTGTGWVLVENPRYGTLDAKPDERQYVWVREDKAANLTVAPPNVVQGHLDTAPGQLSAAHGLALPVFNDVRVEAPEGRTVNVVDMEACRRESATKVTGAKFNALETTGAALAVLSLNPLLMMSWGAAAEQKKEEARQKAVSMALDKYRECMRARGYRVDGVSDQETKQAVPAPSDPNEDCPAGLVRSRGGAWCVVEKAGR